MNPSLVLLVGEEFRKADPLLEGGKQGRCPGFRGFRPSREGIGETGKARGRGFIEGVPGNEDRGGVDRAAKPKRIGTDALPPALPAGQQVHRFQRLPLRDFPQRLRGGDHLRLVPAFRRRPHPLDAGSPKWARRSASDGPASHSAKAGTPTMGGILIVFSLVLSSLLWVRWDSKFFWIALLSILWYRRHRLRGRLLEAVGQGE